MIKRIRKKLHNKKAFTLAEMLMAVLILLMAASIVATGIPVAKNAYDKVVLASNSEVLLSTTISTLRNEIGTAMKVDIPGVTMNGNVKTGQAITYYNSTRGASSKIFMDSSNTDIMFQRYTNNDGLSVGSDDEKLISDAIATNDLHVVFENVSYDYKNRIVSFKNIAVKKDENTITIKSLSIRVLSD